MQPHTLLVHIFLTSLASASVLQEEARQVKEERGQKSPLAVRDDCRTNCLLNQSFCQSSCAFDPKTRTIDGDVTICPPLKSARTSNAVRIAMKPVLGLNLSASLAAWRTDLT
ncbi:hypothetical protein E4U43_002141 [Claviceps pusilla]|uniref:Uncharacterized protein n=1 Tax=Claviceps pusilla TaxID=123648 RepID=A0A9P7N7X4_9HYPO|nr:hypothetical protein E4U43_002141 [Claviceps pusilla]